MTANTSVKKRGFFSKDHDFYRSFRQMAILVVLNNLITYSVNMIDNVMLGAYSQNALSGAAAVNQIFFLIQQFAISLGSALVVLASQYWGEGKIDPIRTLTGHLFRFSLICGMAIVAICACIPYPILQIFSASEAIIQEGTAYLSIVQWTYPLFMCTTILTSALRSVDNTRPAFVTAIVSLFVNIILNYLLIYGNFGFPRLGIRGAAIATLIARILELFITVFYLAKMDKDLHLFSRFFGPGSFLGKDKALSKSLIKIAAPVTAGTMLWSVTVPLQTAILGNISDDAMAANAAASTFYQYLKVVITALSNVSASLIGNAIGEVSAHTVPGRQKDFSSVREKAHVLSLIDVLAGIVLGVLLFVLRRPILSMYQLSETALRLSDHMLIILSVVMVGMSYQMPVSSGILQAGGDIRFIMTMNLVSVWLIVMPLSFLGAFVWKWPVELVVIAIQSDQIFKCLPVFLRFHSYKWIRELT